MQTAFAQLKPPNLIMPPTDLEPVFNAHSGMIFRTAYRITGNAADAEDVLQTVFLRLLKRPADMLHPDSYLRRSAINAALDLIRGRDRQAAPIANLDPPIRGGAYTKVAIREALAALEPREAEIFALRFFEGHENAEIAEMLGMSKIHVAVTVHRTRIKLQKTLQMLPK